MTIIIYIIQHVMWDASKNSLQAEERRPHYIRGLS